MAEYIVRETGYPGTIKQETVGELVRCQNCKHGYFAGTALYCDKQSRSHAWHKAAIDWFCADGERREDE